MATFPLRSAVSIGNQAEKFLLSSPENASSSMCNRGPSSSRTLYISCHPHLNPEDINDNGGVLANNAWWRRSSLERIVNDTAGKKTRSRQRRSSGRNVGLIVLAGCWRDERRRLGHVFAASRRRLSLQNITNDKGGRILCPGWHGVYRGSCRLLRSSLL